MKKIIGSPIGLGEVNLTVDNRVRRCIKEYFGDVVEPVNDELVVSDEFFKGVLFDTTYKRARSSNVTPKDDEEYLIILLVAEEQFLNKIFMITDPDGSDLPNKSEFFIPFKKGFKGMLESKPLLMKKSLLNKIWVDGVNGKAKLPETEDEKEAAQVWKKDKDETAKITANAAQDTEDSSKKTKNDCVQLYGPNCARLDEENNECKEHIEECVESKTDACCVTKDCINKKTKFQINQWNGLLINLLVFFWGVFLIAFFRYSDVYGHRHGNFLLIIVNGIRKIFGKETPGIDEDFGYYKTIDSETGDVNSKGGDLLVDSAVFMVIFLVLALVTLSLFLVNKNGGFVKLVPCKQDDYRERINGLNCPGGSQAIVCGEKINGKVCLGGGGCGDGREKDHEKCACDIKTVE